MGISPVGDEGEKAGLGQKRGGGEEDPDENRRRERLLYDNGSEKLNTCPKRSQEPTRPQSVESPGEVSTMLFLSRDNDCHGCVFNNAVVLLVMSSGKELKVLTDSYCFRQFARV